jgi:hypothetical protein
MKTPDDLRTTNMQVAMVAKIAIVAILSLLSEMRIRDIRHGPFPSSGQTAAR